MTKNQTPYGHGNSSRRSKSRLSAADVSSYSESTAAKPAQGVTTSALDGTVTLRRRGIYLMRKPAVIETLEKHGATHCAIENEGNVFHLTAIFPDVDSAKLARDAIGNIVKNR